MKNIVGLDLGTNSIGWAVVNGSVNDDGSEQLVKIQASGSRIIPMDAAMIGDFNKGNSISQTAERTRLRGVRRLSERYLLRRERLHRILDILGFLPFHFAQDLDRHGKIVKGKEPKLAWRKNEAGQFEFIFQDSFKEMLEDFKLNYPNLITDNKKVPYDWTIYYLRKKGLTSKISKEELAWILLNFNQKRGYYQLRGEEEEENKDKLVEFYALKVVAVEDSGEKKGKDIWYNVHLENGWVYRRTSNMSLDWVGKTKEFIVTTDLEKDGTPKKDKEGNVKRSFRAPKEDDWSLVKKKTEADIDQTHKTVGAYIYDTLLGNPSQKIRGRLVRTIERKYYKEELKLILEKQKEFHLELQDRALYAACIEELYPINEAHRNNVGNRDFTYLFLEDILFYQRPLKSKKSLIDNCPYEENQGLDKETGEIKSFPVKCIAKSHPLFQEFRLWQFIINLRIYRKDLAQDVDVTNELLKTEEDYVALFDWLNGKKEIDQKAFLKYPVFGLKKEIENYRWNYVQDKPYPCNETRSLMLARLEKCDISIEFLTKENEEALWHILYSVEDKNEIVKALQKFADKHDLNASFVDVFQKFPPFKKEYGSYSAKAIKKLLPLMRMGKYWSENSIDKGTRERIDKIITGEYDEKIENRVREKAIHLADVSDFKGLPLWLVCYIVYGRHSEAKEIIQWKSPADIDSYLRSFKQHSLRNPIVEQIIIETLRVVRDIWKQVGNIDEIHVELGREMKNPADKRKKMTQQMSENENTNLRIKYLLTEFLNPEYEVENVRPYSPSQQDILRIYEEGVLNSVSDLPEEISDILKKFTETDLKKRPSRSEVLRYKLWLEQKYRSPYTGEVIPLGKLFTPAYEIEHVIIGVVVLDHKQITITSGVLESLLENNCAVITCDSKSMPVGLMLPLYGNTTQNERFRQQLDASLPLKKQLWQQTIKAKIDNQASVLRVCVGEEMKCMRIWANEVKSGDPENLEARAAAFFWKNLFADIIGFTRDREGISPNNLLNYGYAILRAIVARALVASGLLPTLGIHHHNRYNAYCLADDVMEPYRPYVDELVFSLVKLYGANLELTKEIKSRLLVIPTLDVRINGKRSPLMVAVAQTTASLYKCFCGEIRRISYPER